MVKIKNKKGVFAVALQAVVVIAALIYGFSVRNEKSVYVSPFYYEPEVIGIVPDSSVAVKKTVKKTKAKAEKSTRPVTPPRDFLSEPVPEVSTSENTQKMTDQMPISQDTVADIPRK